jgi:hypothetical protein
VSIAFKHCNESGYQRIKINNHRIITEEHLENELSDTLLIRCSYCGGIGVVDRKWSIDDDFGKQYKNTTFWSILFNTDNLLNKIISLK